MRAWSFRRRTHRRCLLRPPRATSRGLRRRLGIDSNGIRLIHGEADGLPGLIVDQYDDILSAQFLSAGTERWKDAIADAWWTPPVAPLCMSAPIPVCAAWKVSQPVTGWLRHPETADGSRRPTEVTITENGRS